MLDEIGEMSLACQAKLLRLLEGHPFERLGGTEPVKVDVRIVAATHRHLPDRVEAGNFREDLYFRLRVIELPVPPLRERGDDIVLLAEHLLEHFRHQTGRGPLRLSNQAVVTLKSHHWPGNVRELKNAIERATAMRCCQKTWGLRTGPVDRRHQKLTTRRRNPSLFRSSMPSYSTSSASLSSAAAIRRRPAAYSESAAERSTKS